MNRNLMKNLKQRFPINIKKIKSIIVEKVNINKKLYNNSMLKMNLILQESREKLITKGMNKVNINFAKNTFNYLQDKLEQKISNENEEVLLKQSPFWARSITWTLIGGTLLGIGWLGFAKTEEIIVVQGKLEPLKKVVNVQIPRGGLIQEILVNEGDYVEKDQVLVRLDSKVSKSSVKSLQEIIELNESILKNFETLLEAGAITELQYIQQKTKLLDLKQKLTAGKAEVDYQEIKAPISGKIFEMKPRVKGFVAQTSEEVLKIVPNDDLKAKIEIDSRSIGFVKTGKNVDVSIDSFPATDFGVISGKVKSIGSDALPPDSMQGKGYRFPAVVSLDSQNLELKNGNQLPLQVGMSITANIKLRKVSYLQLLLGTFQDKADSLREL